MQEAVSAATLAAKSDEKAKQMAQREADRARGKVAEAEEKLKSARADRQQVRVLSCYQLLCLTDWIGARYTARCLTAIDVRPEVPVRCCEAL